MAPALSGQLVAVVVQGAAQVTVARLAPLLVVAQTPVLRLKEKIEKENVECQLKYMEKKKEKENVECQLNEIYREEKRERKH